MTQEHTSVRDSFKKNVLAGDYIPNSATVARHSRQQELQGKITEWSVPSFEEQFGEGGSKSWMIEQDYDCTLSELLEAHPDLKELIEYGNYVVKEFEAYIRSCTTEKELNDLLDVTAARREATKNYTPELDEAYQRHLAEQKKELEAPGEGDMSRGSRR